MRKEVSLNGSNILPRVGVNLVPAVGSIVGGVPGLEAFRAVVAEHLGELVATLEHPCGVYGEAKLQAQGVDTLQPGGHEVVHLALGYGEDAQL